MRLAGAAFALAAALAAPARDPDLVAPADAWLMRGGSPSRSGAARGDPPRGRLDEAWRFAPPGGVAGEPRVLGDRVVVAAADGRNHALHVLSLADGSDVVPPRRLSIPIDPAPSLEGEHLVCRAEVDRLEVLRLPRGGSRTFQRVVSIPLDGPASEPILCDGRIYVRAGDAIVRLRPGSREPEWRAEGGFAGEIAVAGDSVYAVAWGLSHDQPVVHRLDRETGGSLAAAPLGKQSERTGREQGATPHVLGGRVCVRFGVPLLALHGEPVRTARIVIGDRGFDSAGLALFEGGAEPALARDRRLTVVRDGDAETLALYDDGADTLIALATRDHRPDLVIAGARPSVLGDLAFVGATGFELDGNRRIALELPVAPRERVVLGRRTLLAVDERGALSAWRAATAARAPWRTLIAPADAAEFKGAAVLRDGSVERGLLRFDVVTGECQRTKGNQRPLWKAGDLDAVVHGEHRVLAAAGPGALIRAVEALAAPTDGGEAEPEAAAVVAFVAAVEAALPSDAPFELREALLRFVLDAGPSSQAHPEARAAVRRLLPRGVAVAEDFDARDWLDFAAAARRTAVELVPGSFDESDPDLTVAQRLLGGVRATWRPDLEAVASRSLLVMTPLAAPGRVANCLVLGELVCAELEAIFDGEGQRRDARFPLQLHLFESSEEYRAESLEARVDPDGLEWTAGHFDPRNDVSRIYLPAADDQFARVQQVYAHELTHHWLDERCPRFTPADLKRTPGTPGFWLVEGFASLIEEFVFDLDAGTVTRFDPNASSLGIVAALGERQKIGWASLFAANQAAFLELEAKAGLQIRSPRHLGTALTLSPIHLFYEQSTAACHYLFHAEGGRHRAALLELLARHYRGEYQVGMIAELVGCTPAELGVRVEAFARAPSAD